jgi:hypothetical protein
MSPSIHGFIQTWKNSAGNERANKDSFLRELCEALEIEVPGPKDQHSDYCFEKDLKITHLDGSTSTGSIDLFKAGCFVLEAKQGSTKEKKGSSPVRGTRAYDQYMEKAFGQAVNYAIRLPQRPPFLMTCDIGHAFHIWDSFSGSYGGYGARRTVPLAELARPEVQEWFRAIWENPQSLDPGKRRALVTRQVASELGHLAARLESRFPSKAVANFLMRCVFTFFAEDVGLLPSKVFERSLERWRKEPERFTRGLERLWDAMNSGDDWGEFRLARFNGGLFAETHVPELFAEEIELLHQAARFDWGDVDPSIFGTLLETALSPEERHKLGAHYTPRSFIERLIRPTIEEPLRADWDLVQAEALTILGPEPTDQSRAKARDVLHLFHRKLASTRILDPACGSGNFLYVAYDFLKRLEQEVLCRLDDFGETRRTLALDEVMVTPAQFLGLEVKPWAAAIAELVLWIGHLQWWIRLHPGSAPLEPILQKYENIQCRDAVLTWTGTRETGRTRWDGKTFKKHPVTGKDVPDETAQTPILEYLEPKPARWPEADFIVGNPPFLGNKRMREVLGDGYSEALRKAYPDVPASVDFVLYWWHKAAEAVQLGLVRRFGLITTNSISQTFNRRVVAFHISGKHPVKLVWAVPDHPWADEGAAVRIAMTVAGREGIAWLGKVVDESSDETPEGDRAVVEGCLVETIHADLRVGPDLTGAIPLRSNSGVCFQGCKLVGAGFQISPLEAIGFEKIDKHASLRLPKYWAGSDLTQSRNDRHVIDLFGLSQLQAKTQYPGLYQHLFDRVRPIRDKCQRKGHRENWWLFGEKRPAMRKALKGIHRYIATSEIAKYRTFSFLRWPDDMVDGSITIVASADAFIFGVLSSIIHVTWALAAGGRMGIGNDPRWQTARCFDPFPFPLTSEDQKGRIRDLAERLDAHRKTAQGRGVTITQMYNLLEKLRSGEPFSPKDQVQHQAAQTEILRQLHDELDKAVLDAYGWPTDTEDAEILERLVALNRERAVEEAKGVVRWLRPEYQCPQSIQPITQPLMVEEPEEAVQVTPVPAIAVQPWPKDLKEQLAALRGLLLSSDHLWTLEEIGSAFKSRGRYRESIHAHLGLLTDLGVLVAIDTTGGARFHRPQAVGA